MRLDDPRLARLAAAATGAVGRRLVRGGVRGPPAVHRGRPARGRGAPPRPPQGPPADLRPVRRAAVLRRRRHDPRRPVPSRRRRRPRGVRGLLAPVDTAAPRPRRGADPGQRLVVARTRPGAHERGRPRDGDLVANADADVRAADDVVRGVLQPRRRGRVTLVLGRVRGDRADRRAASSARRCSRRACSWWTSTSPTCDASGSRCPCCATSARSWWRASGDGSSPSGQASRGVDGRGRRSRRLDIPVGRERRGGGRAAAAPDGDGRRCSSCPTSSRSTPTSRAGDRRVHPRPARAGRVRARRCSDCRAGSTRRWSRTSWPRPSGPSGSCAC